MKDVTKTGKTSSAWKKPIPEIEFSYTFKAYETRAEVDAAGAGPSDEEVVDWANGKRESSARNSAQTKAWLDAGHVKPTLENDDALRYKTVFDAFMASKKYTAEEAKNLACTTLGLDPETF